MNRRNLVLVLCASLVMSSLGACGKNEDFEDELRAAMRRTEAQPRAFFYTDETGRQKVAVRGAVEDDFRYRARVEVDDRPTLDEVASDDVLADRLLDPERLAMFVSKTPTAAAEPNVVQALKNQTWVVDPGGAPSLIAGAKEERKVGDDFVVDSLNVFRYVEQAIIDSPVPRVVRFNPESISYRPKEDPFPRPVKGVLRYDLTRSRVPRRSENGGNQSVPSTSVFRKMSVYVKDGQVVEIREFIDIGARLNDLRKNFGIDLSKSTSVDAAIAEVVTGINAVRKGQGLDLLRPRRMRARFTDIGTKTSVEVPTEGVVDGKLGFLINRGKQAVNETPSSTTVPGAPPGDGTGTATTGGAAASGG